MRERNREIVGERSRGRRSSLRERGEMGEREIVGERDQAFLRLREIEKDERSREDQMRRLGVESENKKESERGGLSELGLTLRIREREGNQ